MWWLDIPIIAQFLVLGILKVSVSTSHPQWALSEANHIRYIEYELVFVPSPPRFRLSTNSSLGISNPGVVVLSYRESNDHAQHGIDRYPEAAYRVDKTGTQGVSSSAWFPIMNTPFFKNKSDSIVDGDTVGLKAWTWRFDWLARE